MAYHTPGKGNLCLVYNQKRLRLSSDQVCKCLGISRKTYNHWLINPFLITFGNLCKLAGMYGISVHELTYCLMLNIPRVKERDKWYLGEVKERGDVVQLSIEELKNLGK